MNESKSENTAHLGALNPASQWALLLSLLVSILLADFTEVFAWIAIGMTTVLLTRFSRVPVRLCFEHLKRFYPMIFIMTILLPFTSAGYNDSVVYTIAGHNVYRLGLCNFFNVNIKSIFILISFFAVVKSTGLKSLSQMFHKMGARRTAVILLFLIRFIDLLKAELRRSLIAFRSRKIKMKRWQTIKSFAGLMSVFFVRLLERSERNYLSLAARGFNGRICITGSQAWGRWDNLALMFSVGLVMVIAWNV